MPSLVQLTNPQGERRVALVDGDQLRLLEGTGSVYELSQRVMGTGEGLAAAALASIGRESLSYEAAYAGSEWHILPAFDHSIEPARCFVTGTGLTHRASVDNRDAMHQKAARDAATVTDSMRMYEWGLAGGRPSPGGIGVSPEWFYKGNGTCLRGHGDWLRIPAFAEDGGDESEIAGVYLIDEAGQPRRVGMTQGNEFSDHVFEKKNYLYLASSKLRDCSIGPELILDPDFQAVAGVARIYRGSHVLWEKPIRSGEENMCHSLENMEHHHFKFPLHRRPGDVHVHFFGASALSFGDGVRLGDGDVMEVHYEGFGRPLRNPIRIEDGPVPLARAIPL